MSAETLEWLNNNTLIGFTSKRGNAWHYREGLQGSEGNHYVDAIPVDDVVRRLFDFEVVERPLYMLVECGFDEATAISPDGNPAKLVEVANRKAMATDDTHDVLGVFKDSYQGHGYKEWLLEGPAKLLDADLSIGSAGLLKNRAVAWVQVEMPENIATPEGVVFRPNLLAATSFDGSMASLFKRMFTNVICDNTMAAGLGEQSETFKVKHSRNSTLRIGQAREALGIIYDAADEFSAQIAKLCATTVTDPQFGKVLDLMVPKGDGTSKRATTLGNGKRDKLTTMWATDPRCAPWKNTAWGVVQTFNTWLHHEAPQRGAKARAERNMDNVLSGATDTFDTKVLNVLDHVLTTV